MDKREYVKRILTTVKANVNANFELNGFHNLRTIPLVSYDIGRIYFIVNDIYGNESSTILKIKLDEKREELHIIDLSYKLLLWLNDLTFDKRCDYGYNDEEI